MTAEACAALVAKGDPDRYRAAMVAAPERRAGLFALYAFNLELARAPWVASEPLLGRIRLQWWADALEEIAAGRPTRRHEVVAPLAEAGLPLDLLRDMLAAREFDTEGGRHPDLSALEAYVRRTSGHLAEAAARHLGAGEAAVPVVRRFAQGAGTAALLRALPVLRARGRDPLPPDVDVPQLVDLAWGHLRASRRERTLVPAVARPALLAGWKADAILARAGRDPTLDGPLEPPEAWARAVLIWRAVSGRW